jgi:hypothetical protein
MTPFLTLAALLTFTPPADDPSSKVESVTLRGKVVDLAGVLKSKGIAADSEPIAGQVVMAADDGSFVPLVSDEASRALFLDKRLRDRKVEVVGRKLSGLPYLQVVNFKVEEAGAMRTPEYYCDICAIHVRYPQTCPCCQGPMVLQMKPEGR